MDAILVPDAFDVNSLSLHSGSRVQKIIVSATVSHDVKQLKLLELHKPRLLCPSGGKERRYRGAAEYEKKKELND